MNLTFEQIEALKQGQPIRLTPEEVGEEVVLLNAKTYQQLCASQEEDEELKLRSAWQKATQRGLGLILQDKE
jgi:hypothetical protein